MSERALWATVAITAIDDAARMIAASRNRIAAQKEINRQRRYFESADWRMVASLAGIDVSPCQVMHIISTPGAWNQSKINRLTRDAIREREKDALRRAGA